MLFSPTYSSLFSDLDVFNFAESLPSPPPSMEPLFPDLDLDEDPTLDFADLDMSGLDSASLPQVSRASFSSCEGLDESGETFLDLSHQIPSSLINVSAPKVGGNIINNNGVTRKDMAQLYPRSTKENGRNKKRVPEIRQATDNEPDTNSDTESISSNNVPRPRKDPNLSKNAIAARENRLKKKKYMEDLENNSKHLSAENLSLKSRVDAHESAIKKLEGENAYLRGVLANVDEITALLRSVKNTPGVKFTTSLKRKSEPYEDHKYCSSSTPKKRRSQGSTSSVEDSGTESIKTEEEDSEVGICLCVSRGLVSVEFCKTCSHNVTSQRQKMEESGDEDS